MYKFRSNSSDINISTAWYYLQPDTSIEICDDDGVLVRLRLGNELTLEEQGKLVLPQYKSYLSSYIKLHLFIIEDVRKNEDSKWLCGRFKNIKYTFSGYQPYYYTEAARKTFLTKNKLKSRLTTISNKNAENPIDRAILLGMATVFKERGFHANVSAATVKKLGLFFRAPESTGIEFYGNVRFVEAKSPHSKSGLNYIRLVLFETLAKINFDQSKCVYRPVDISNPNFDPIAIATKLVDSIEAIQKALNSFESG